MADISVVNSNRLVPALPNTATQFLNGTGAFSTPATTGGGTQKLVSAYASLSAAYTAAAGTDLVIDVPVSVTATGATPADVNIVWRETGVFNVPAGLTLTISKSNDTSTKQRFAGAGVKVFAAKAAPYFHLSWWSGADETVDQTNNIRDALQSAANSVGGTIFVSAGNWLTTGNHEIPRLTTLQGMGQRITTFQLTGTATKLFTITTDPAGSDANFKHININNMRLNCGNIAGSRAVYISGANGTALYGIRIKNVTFRDIAAAAIQIEDTTAGGGYYHVETEMILVEHCNFELCGLGFRCGSINGSYKFLMPYFYMSANQGAFQLDYSGQFTCEDHLITGHGPRDASNNLTDSSFILRVQGDHGPIVFRGGQDEGVKYFLTSPAGYPNLSAKIILEDNAIQCLIAPQSSCTVSSRNNTLNAGSVADTSGAQLVFISNNDRHKGYNLANSASTAPITQTFLNSTSYTGFGTVIATNGTTKVMRMNSAGTGLEFV